MRLLFIVSALVMLAGCTPRDVAYCQRQGISPDNPEYANCMGYFAKNQAEFDRDYNQCLGRARQTYPDYLYDYSPRLRYGLGYGHGFYHHSRHHHHSSLWYDDNDDYWRNAQVTRLRNSIIAPCMSNKGWNDPFSWEAGRHKPAKGKRAR